MSAEVSQWMRAAARRTLLRVKFKLAGLCGRVVSSSMAEIIARHCPSAAPGVERDYPPHPPLAPEAHK